MIVRHKIGRSQSRAAAFTLVEVTLMIGIVIFALLPMVGMLALGKDSSRKTVDRTRAVLIAESIFGNLRTSTESGLRIQVEPELYNTSLTAANCVGQEAYIVYDDRAAAFAVAPSNKYESGWDSGGNVETMVKISFEKPSEIHDLGSEKDSEIAKATDLILVTVSVEAPVNAPEANRRKEEFRAFMVLTDQR